jgi:hypothetical protein
VFLATPHRGSKSAVWAEIGTRMLKAAKLGTSGTSSAKELKFFSTTVQNIEEDFVPLSSKFKIVSFFEQKGYPGLGLVMLHSAIVVRLLIICGFRLWKQHRPRCKSPQNCTQLDWMSLIAR